MVAVVCVSHPRVIVGRNVIISAALSQRHQRVTSGGRSGPIRSGGVITSPVAIRDLLVKALSARCASVPTPASLVNRLSHLKITRSRGCVTSVTVVRVYPHGRCSTMVSVALSEG